MTPRLASFIQQTANIRAASAVAMVLMLLVTVVRLEAADSIVGVWKLDVARSTFSTAIQAVPPRDITEVIREIDGDRIELTQRGVDAEGAPIMFRATYPARGGMATIIDADESTEGVTAVETLVSAGEWYVTILRDGEQIIVRHKLVSADGRTKTETVRGTDEEGRPFEQIEVYERVE